jgi:hypothetical protein
MTSAPDMTASIEPRSDQVNAEDLITGPRTVTITDVKRGTTEQPVNIGTTEFGPGRPYKPSKTMRRIIVSAWGTNTSTYIGRRITIYRDPDITFGRDRVGGIRISHLSHLEKRLEIALTVTRGRRSTFSVDPLPDEPPPQDTDIVTKAQLQKLSILRQKENYADTDEGRADWFQWVNVNIGRLVGSNKDLTKAEASVLIDVLENTEATDE